MSTSLYIKLLGDFCLTANGLPITKVNAERLQALLAFILLHGDTPRSRQQIAIQLWPDATDADAKANLRRRLHELKQLIPQADRWLRIETKTVQWVQNPDCLLDVAEFEAVIFSEQPTLQALEQAARLYQGDLLPTCYDDWIVPYRDQLRQRAITTLETLISLLSNQNSVRPAIAYAHQLQRIDPLYEPGYCHLMRLHAQEGDRASALRAYHQCMTVLQAELGVNPSPTTSRLYEDLLNLEDAPPLPSDATIAPPLSLAAPPLPEASSVLTTSDLPLIGRQAEWTVIQQWMADCVVRTSTDLLFLIGEPGIGKTRLLEELAQEMQLTRGYILWGRGFEAEMLRPYGVWADAFQAIGATEFLNELRSLVLNTDPAATLNRGRLFDMAAQFIAQLGDTAPVLVVLDDIQWLDETSIAFLHYVARLLSHQLPIWFACAARKREVETNVPAYRLIQALHRERRIRVVEVPPLDRLQTLALAQAVGCDVDCDQIFANSGGNPLFTLEIARTQPQSGGTAPGTLETLIQGRLVQLDESTRHLVSWAAALGRSFNPTILANIVDLPLPRLLTVIDQLEQHGIIRPSSEMKGEPAYDFVHDIVRQVAYEQFSQPRRQLIHTHIAQSLNALASPTTQLINDVAHHADLGSDHELAASAALMAAERCLRVFAYTEAAELAQRGIHHCQNLEAATRVRLQLSLLKAYVKAGVSREQVSTLQQTLQHLIQEAAALKLKDEEALGLEALIVLNYDHGNLSEVQRHSLRAAEQGRTASPATTMYMLARTGSCLAEIGRDIPRAEALLLEAQAISDRLGLETIDIPYGLGCVRRFQGQRDEARSLLRQGWQMSQLAQDHWRECTCLTNLVMLELEAKQPPLALDYCSELIQVSAQMGEGSEAPHAVALDAVIRYLLQEKNAGEALFAIAQVLKKIDSPRILSYMQTVAAAWDLHQGHVDQALLRAEEALEAAQVVDNPSQIALAGAIVIRSNCQLQQVNRAKQHWCNLQAQLNGHLLSALAQQQITQLAKELDQLVAIAGGGKP